MGTTARWMAKAKQGAKHAASTLKAEYEAGRRGDEAPVQPIWPSPREQLDGLLSLWKQQPPAAAAADAAGTTSAPDDAPTPDDARTPDIGDAVDAVVADEAVAEAVVADEAAEVAAAMRGIDWAAVRGATAERTSEAARAMRSAAEHVDWVKVQPVAAQVSSALLAAVATGRIGVGGKLGSTVARTIVDQGGLAQRVAHQLRDQPSAMPVEFRGIIEATARDTDTPPATP